jgi:hypothetical protein
MTILDDVILSARDTDNPIPKAKLIDSVSNISIREINDAIRDIRTVAAKWRVQVYRLMDSANILSDEVCRRAEEMEQRP